MMYTLTPKRDTNRMVGKVPVVARLGHLSQKAVRHAHKGSKRLKTRADQKRAALAN